MHLLSFRLVLLVSVGPYVRYIQGIIQVREISEFRFSSIDVHFKNENFNSSIVKFCIHLSIISVIG